jgi:hypothetical protein
MVAAVVDPALVSGQGIDVGRNGVKALWKSAPEKRKTKEAAV